MNNISSQQRSDAPLNLDSQLCFPIYAASHLMAKAYQPLLKPLKLTYPQYLVMLVLWEHKQASVGELGQRLYLDSGTLTPMLKRLQATGYIQRCRSAEDERKVLITLTQEGEQLYTQAQRVPEMLACALSGNNTCLATLRNDLSQLVDTLYVSSQQ